MAQHPPVRSERSPRFRRYLPAATVFVLLVVLAGVFLSVWPAHTANGRRPLHSTRRRRRAREPNQDAAAAASRQESPGYVGPDACAACHAERVAEGMRHKHFHTFRTPCVEEMPPPLENGYGSFVTRFSGLRFEMSRRGTDFFQTAIRPTAAGEQRTTNQIDFVLGAGSADDVYVTWHDDGEMYELPMAWLWTRSEWGAAYFDPHDDGDFSRPLTVRCLECHNTWFEHVPGTINEYRREHDILGVTCERCHGPGRDHVAWHKARPGETVAGAIVNPAELSRERQIEVCTQCHSNAIQHRRPPFTYRPGEPLADYYRTLEDTDPEEDHVANQIEALRQSRCFQQSEMTCTTCHDPHRASGPGNAGSASCLQCHEADHCYDQRRLPAAVRSDCVGCHMPPLIKINVNFQTADDGHVPPIRRWEHRIAVHPTARQDVLWQWFALQNDADSRVEAARLKSELGTHWLVEAEHHRHEHRFLAAISDLREAQRLEASPETRQMLDEAVSLQNRIDDLLTLGMRQIATNQHQQARTTFESLLRIKPDHAEAHGRLGTLYAMAGDRARAARHLHAVREHDPNNAYGVGMLGWLAFLDGRLEEALEHLTQAAELEPYNSRIQREVGMTLMRLDRVPEAIRFFRQATRISPREAEAYQWLSAALRRDGELTEAEEAARRAASLTQQEEPQPAEPR